MLLLCDIVWVCSCDSLKLLHVCPTIHSQCVVCKWSPCQLTLVLSECGQLISSSVAFMLNKLWVCLHE